MWSCFTSFRWFAWREALVEPDLGAAFGDSHRDQPARRSGSTRLACWLAVVLLVVSSGSGTFAAEADLPRQPLTDIREIRALSPEKAGEALPVVVRGVVTRATS